MLLCRSAYRETFFGIEGRSAHHPGEWPCLIAFSPRAARWLDQQWRRRWPVGSGGAQPGRKVGADLTAFAPSPFCYGDMQPRCRSR
jgi:hypothetical protein